ncbi:hypothetical protein P4L29_22625 [Bacillus cereus]|nr:hypothetical protein [Bacillus cereus]
MKKMMVGRLFMWFGAGAFAGGIRYGILGDPKLELVQYVGAAASMAYGMHLIAKGGEKNA